MVGFARGGVDGVSPPAGSQSRGTPIQFTIAQLTDEVRQPPLSRNAGSGRRVGRSAQPELIRFPMFADVGKGRLYRCRQSDGTFYVKVASGLPFFVACHNLFEHIRRKQSTLNCDRIACHIYPPGTRT